MEEDLEDASDPGHRSEEAIFMEIARAVLEKDIDVLRAMLLEANERSSVGRLREVLLEDQDRGRGKTLLEEAVYQDNYEMVITILEACLPGVSPRVTGREEASVEERKSVSKPKASFFRKNSGFLNDHRKLKKPDANRDSALHWACFFGQVKTVCALLRYGYSPLDVDSVGNTALHLAVAGAKKSGVEYNKNRDRVSPHHLIVEMLISEPGVLQKTAYARNNYGNTPLDLASTSKALSQLFKKAIEWMKQGDEKQESGFFSKSNLWSLSEKINERVDQYSKANAFLPAIKDVEEFKADIEEARKFSLDVDEARTIYDRVSTHAALLKEISRLEQVASPSDISERKFMNQFTQLLRDAKRCRVSKDVIRRGLALRKRRILASVLRSRLASYVKTPTPAIRENLQTCLNEGLATGLSLADPFASVAHNLLVRDSIEQQLVHQTQNKMEEHTTEAVSNALQALEKALNDVNEHNERILIFLHDSIITSKIKVYFESRGVNISLVELQSRILIPRVAKVDDLLKQLRKQLTSKRGKKNHGKKGKAGGQSKKAGKDKPTTKKGKRKKQK